MRIKSNVEWHPTSTYRIWFKYRSWDRPNGSYVGSYGSGASDMPWKLWTTHEDCLATHLFTKFCGVAICQLEIIVTLIFRRFGLKMLIRIIHAPKMFFWDIWPPVVDALNRSPAGWTWTVFSWMPQRRIRVVRSTIVRPINYCGEVWPFGEFREKRIYFFKIVIFHPITQKPRICTTFDTTVLLADVKLTMTGFWQSVAGCRFCSRILSLPVDKPSRLYARPNRSDGALAGALTSLLLPPGAETL